MTNELHNKPIVIIESPYAGDIERNVKYASDCMADSLARGEAPYASHLLYTQDGVLDDNNPDERELGITAGFAFKHIPGAVTAFYVDYGVSSGMQKALDYCKAHGLDYETREIATYIDVTSKEDYPQRRMLKYIAGDLVSNSLF